MQRKRGRGRRSGGNNNNPNRHYESTGPDVKIRGSAQQILDKYLQYARDAQTAGDRVKAEAHFQHAEHYARIVATFQKDKQRNKSDDNNNSDDDDDNDNNSSDSRSDDDNTQPNSDQSKSSENDNADGKKPKNRSRKPRENKDDPLRVIGSDGGDTSAPDDQTDDKPAAADATSDHEDKPKPRRRSYKKKTQEPEQAGENEGVMSTLSRGRSDSPNSEDKEKQTSRTEAAE